MLFSFVVNFMDVPLLIVANARCCGLSNEFQFFQILDLLFLSCRPRALTISTHAFMLSCMTLVACNELGNC